MKVWVVFTGAQDPSEELEGPSDTQFGSYLSWEKALSTNPGSRSFLSEGVGALDSHSWNISEN